MQPSTSSFNSSNAPSARRPTSSYQSQMGQGELQPIDDLVEYVTSYARQNPGATALWCFGVGFIIGWKLKPW